MFHKGLNKEILVTASTELIEEKGMVTFSMRALADKLNVKTASLYTHIESMEDLFTAVELYALKMQKNAQLSAVHGLNRDSAVLALADISRNFAKEHAELYRLIMQMPAGKNETLKSAAAMTAEPAMQVLSDYHIPELRKMHWQRVLRGVIHGFISQENAGYFSHYPVDIKDSYRLAVQCIITGLHEEEKQNE